MELLNNIDKIHTTKMGIDRIKKNLNIDCEVVSYLKDKIINPDSIIEKNGKNYYVKIDGIIITINSFSYTIITAHKIK
jgi:phosphoketolase